MNINPLVGYQPIDRPNFAPFARCLSCGWLNHFPEPHHPECEFHDSPGRHFDVIVFEPKDLNAYPHDTATN